MMGGRLKLLFSLLSSLALSIASHPAYSQENANNPAFMNQFFSEQTLTVNQEGDALSPGTLRTVLIQAAGIRKNNPFTLIKIVFDPNVRISRIIKGSLRITEGLTQIDCANKVTIDGTGFDNRFVDEKESLAGILILSSGNSIKNCKITGFPGKSILISGNRNHIRENIIGVSIASRANNPYAQLAGNLEEGREQSSTGIYLNEGASENLIESNNILGHKSEGVGISALAGTGNKIVGNAFSENGIKGIQAGENAYRSSKVFLKSISKENDSYLLMGTLAEAGEVEIYLASHSGREGKMPITPPLSIQRGDFAFSLKNKGFIPGVTKIVALVSSPGKNTSEFSEPVLIPLEAPRPELIPQAPAPVPSNPVESSNPDIPSENSPTTSSLPSTANPSTAPSIDPFLNSTTLPPPPVPQVVEPPRNTGLMKSGSSDSVRMESTFSIGNAP